MEEIDRLHSDGEYWMRCVRNGLEMIGDRMCMEEYESVIMYNVSNCITNVQQMREKNTMQRRVWEEYKASKN